MPTEAADKHLKMRKQLRRMPRPYLMIALFAVQLFPTVAPAQLKLGTDQQMIEELLEATASISDVVFEGAAFYKGKVTATDFSSAS
jgi:hypothetical protein